MAKIIIMMIILSVFLSTTEWFKSHQTDAGIVGGIAVGIIVIFYILKLIGQYYQHKKRINYLKRKYNNDMEIVNSILGKRIWQGQSSEQLLDSLGKPYVVDKKVETKKEVTKTTEVWKYYKMQKNQYALKITLENNQVVGWDKKG